MATKVAPRVTLAKRGRGFMPERVGVALRAVKDFKDNLSEFYDRLFALYGDPGAVTEATALADQLGPIVIGGYLKANQRRAGTYAALSIIGAIDVAANTVLVFAGNDGLAVPSDVNWREAGRHGWGCLGVPWIPSDIMVDGQPIALEVGSIARSWFNNRATKKRKEKVWPRIRELVVDVQEATRQVDPWGIWTEKVPTADRLRELWDRERAEAQNRRKKAGKTQQKLP